MTVRELYNWCKAFRHKDAEVFLVKDWGQVDENSNLTDLYRLSEITTQCVIIEAGMDLIAKYEALLVVEENPAIPTINYES